MPHGVASGGAAILRPTVLPNVERAHVTHQFPAITRLGLGGVALLLVLAGSALPAVASPADTARSIAPPTVEEQRLDRAVPQEILRRSGFDALAPRFAHALEGARGYAQAERVVNRHGSALWRRAVDRAQGRGPATGDLSRGDDRPLYWARLALSRELRGVDTSVRHWTTSGARLCTPLWRPPRAASRTSATRAVR